MSDSVADDMLRNGYDRWQRLEAEKQAISDDLKELFAELKANGFDGKALRAAFRTVAKADDISAQEHNAVVDLYVSSLLGTRIATRTHAARETEITEPQVAPPPAQTDRASEPAASSSPVESEAVAISTPIQPETANTDEPDAQTDGAGDFERDTAQSAPAQLTDGNIVADGLSRSAESHEPDATPAGAVVAETSGVTGGESAAPLSFAEKIKRLRPLCQRPEACRSSGGKDHCWICRKAANGEAAA